MKIKLEGFIAISPSSKEPTYTGTDMTKYGFINVGPIDQEIDYDVPTGWSPEAAEIDMINKKIEELNDEHQSSIKRLRNRVAELQSLPMFLQEQAA